MQQPTVQPRNNMDRPLNLQKRYGIQEQKSQA